MSATTANRAGPWIRVDCAVVTLALLALFLLTSLALLVVLPTGPAAPTTTGQESTGRVATGGVSSPPLQMINEGCVTARARLSC